MFSSVARPSVSYQTRGSGSGGVSAGMRGVSGASAVGFRAQWYGVDEFTPQMRLLVQYDLGTLKTD